MMIGVEINRFCQGISHWNHESYIHKIDRAYSTRVFTLHSIVFIYKEVKLSSITEMSWKPY